MLADATTTVERALAGAFVSPIADDATFDAKLAGRVPTARDLPPPHIEATFGVSHAQASASKWASVGTALVASLAVVAATFPYSEAEIIEREWKPVLGLHPTGVEVERKAVIAELLSFRDLEEGWDGPDSVAPNPGAVNDAISFFDRPLPVGVPLPEAVANADGEVGLYWGGPGVYIDIGFRGVGEISYYGRVGDCVSKGRAAYTLQSALPKPLLALLSELR
jgi:hypothetical protein